MPMVEYKTLKNIKNFHAVFVATDNMWNAGLVMSVVRHPK
jgi:hypothetical protein